MESMSLGSSRSTRRNISAPRSDRKILVAVDFGTTHSAVAWQTRSISQDRIASQMLPGSFIDHGVRRYRHVKDSHITFIVDEWPDKADTLDKVPSTLQYNTKVQGVLKGIPSRWGFETECDDDEPKYQWFKLELDPNLRDMLSREYPKTAIQPKPKDVEKLVTDYLRVLREHAEDYIETSLTRLGDAPLRDVPWEYIITVPAVWPETAQDTTRRCAVRAGMATSGPVQIMTEPEAAALYALQQAVSQDVGINIGDSFVICDAGGGTVDLISYSVISLKPATRIEESAAGSGGLCGSMFLNRQFDDWLRHKMSGFYQWDDGYQADAVARWESEIKRNFNGDIHKRFFISARGLPNTPSLGIRMGKIEVSGREVKALFEPVISDILKLVNSQISETKKKEKSVKAVLLAGGFGRNEYLKKRIQEEVGGMIQVQKMKNCNTAIVRGALIRGLASKLTGPRPPSILVESRITRKHYGTAAWTVYNPKTDDPTRPRIAAGVEGSERIEIMQWFLKKGIKVTESKPASFNYYYDMSERDANQQGGKLDIVALTVYTCDEDVPPKYPDSSKCKELVKLTADLNQIPKEAIDRQKGADNQWYYKIPFHIEMTCHSANISFDLIHQGTKYGGVQAEYI
ncbi:actin-like ATPase domain-containing protein [Nemania sp. FL0031]|nr:actin-like ATPase domain-containing protein [Nemania sp. FL0031]